MSVSSEPETKYDLKELISGLNDNPGGNVRIEKKKVSLHTSETTEYSEIIQLLNIMIETFSSSYLDYVPSTQKILIPLLTYDINEDVRAEASNALPLLLDVIKNNVKENNIDILHQHTKLYISELVAALEKETDNPLSLHF